MKLLLQLTLLAIAALSFTGCSTYIAPGAKADLHAFAPASIQEGFSLKPSNPFPATIAAVRVQSPNYSNYNIRRTGEQYGSGRYSVITTREVENPQDFDRINALPQVAGLVTLNRILLPAKLEGDREIREAASRLQADLVFLYTFDTAFFDSDASTPLTVITLGLSPTRKITAVTTVSALLIDTRTGYIYSTYEITEREAKVSTSWGSRDTADAARRKTETNAFKKLTDDFVTTWPKLLQRYQKKDAAAPIPSMATDGNSN